MSFYQNYLLPRLLHLSMGMKALRPYRARVVGAAEGRVLEFGLGSGLNLPFYGPQVSTVVGVEPSLELLRMARRETTAAHVAVDLIEGTAEALPLDDSSMDTVVTTWTLCTIPDAVQALREARRVLRPRGNLLFVEHGRAPEPGVARWQDRLDPLWSRLAGGCHLNRQIEALIIAAGFGIERLANSRLRGPRTHTYLYEGQARPR